METLAATRITATIHDKEKDRNLSKDNQQFLKLLGFDYSFHKWVEVKTLRLWVNAMYQHATSGWELILTLRNTWWFFSVAGLLRTSKKNSWQTLEKLLFLHIYYCIFSCFYYMFAVISFSFCYLLFYSDTEITDWVFPVHRVSILVECQILEVVFNTFI